jgi:beta-lactamase superfamily II metal-dependent hydrolase
LIESILLGGGNGFGESILILFPNGDIGIIDSCVNPKTKKALSLEYLDENNLNYDIVKFVILTHFHQDHYTGISQIINLCENVEIFTSAALYTASFNFLFHSLLQISSSLNPYSELKTILDICLFKEKSIHILSDISKPILQSNELIVKSCSPNDKTIEYFDSLYKSHTQKLLSESAYIPNKNDFNLQSIVITIESNHGKILYGADMEYHNSFIGWEPVFQIIQDNAFLVFKISHHGSQNGYQKTDCDKILEGNCFLKLTPYSKSKLPRDEMVTNFKTHSDELFSTSLGSNDYKKHPSKLNQLLKDLHIEMKRVNTKVKGSIKFTLNQKTISATIEGTAGKL